MRRLAYLTVAFFAVFCGAAWAQVINVPPNTVLGRLGAGQAGPAQAIPFATLLSQLNAIGGVSGIVNGPGTTTIGHIATWNNATGTLLADDGAGTIGSLTATGSLTTAGSLTATAAGVINQLGAVTTKWFTNDSPPVSLLKANDRVFVGDLTKNLGTASDTSDWLCNFQINTISVGSCYIRSAQFGVESSLNANSGVGVYGAIQTLNMTGGGNVNGVAVEATAVVNNVGTGTNAFAFYGECHQQTNVGTTGCVAMEVDVRNAVAINTQPDPFTQSNLVGVQAACGAGLTTTGHDCGAAIEVVKNPTPWRIGLNFVNGSLDNTGPSSTTIAIGMPANYAIGWFSAANTLAGGLTFDGSNNLVIQVGGTIKVNTSVGVTCPTGLPSSSFATVDGIVTHC